MSPTSLPCPQPSILGPRPSRVVAEVPECATKPLFVIEGTARDVTSPTLRAKMKSPRLEIMRVGDSGLCLSTEHEPGWPMALRLREGLYYTCEIFECKSKVKGPGQLPLDQRIDDGIAFYNVARVLKDRKDEADQRRIQRGYTGVWTDGVMVTTSPDQPHALKPDRVYKVVIRFRPVDA